MSRQSRAEEEPIQGAASKANLKVILPSLRLGTLYRFHLSGLNSGLYLFVFGMFPPDHPPLPQRNRVLKHTLVYGGTRCLIVASSLASVSSSEPLKVTYLPASSTHLISNHSSPRHFLECPVCTAKKQGWGHWRFGGQFAWDSPVSFPGPVRTAGEGSLSISECRCLCRCW